MGNIDEVRYRKNCHRLIRRDETTLLFVADYLTILEVDETARIIIDQGDSVTTADFEQIASSHSIECSQLVEAFNELAYCRLYERDLPDGGPRIVHQPKRDLEKYLPGLWMLPAQDCNLRCNYCSAGHGRFGFESTSLMKRDTAKRALDFLFDNLPSEFTRPVEITFFGGEPLMNFDVLGWTVEYAQRKARQLGKKVSFNMNSNGTLMTEEIASFLSKNGVHCTMSIDGPPYVQNTQRPETGGGGSHEGALRGYQLYKNATPGRPHRTQTVLEDVSQFAESIMHLYSKGTEIFVVNPVFNSAYLDTDYSFTDAEEKEYLRQFKIMNDFFLERNLAGEFVGFTFMLRFMRALYDRTALFPGCGAGRLVAITPDGTFYPCQSLINREELVLGNLEEGLDWDKREAFFRRMVAFADKCLDCFGKFFCGGACIAEAINDGFLDGDLSSRRCSLYQQYLDEAIHMFYRLKTRNPATLRKIIGVEPRTDGARNNEQEPRAVDVLVKPKR